MNTRGFLILTPKGVGRGKAVWFSAVLLIFIPLLRAEAQDVDVPGNLTMVDSTATEGNILKDGVPFLHNFGMFNTFLGANAGNLTMSGGSNTATGVEALRNNTTGEGNTATGVGALRNNTTGGSNTAAGVGALVVNTTGEENTAIGVGALTSNTTGTGNTAIGVEALLGNFTGSDNTAIGSRTRVPIGGNLTNATVIGAGALVDASNKIRLGNADVTVIEGEVGFTASSDRDRKENFQPVEGEEVLGKIRELSLTSWNFIGHDPKQFRHYGPVAQDFFAAFGHDGVGTIGTPTTITSTDMDGILMVAAQALEKRTAEQEKRIVKEMNALRVENADLKARLEAVERRLGSYALTKAE